QGLLRLLLTDHVLVQERADLLGFRQLLEPDLVGLGQLLFDDLVAELDAFVADVDPGSRYELLDLLLGFPAEGALQQVAAVADACPRSLSPLSAVKDPRAGPSGPPPPTLPGVQNRRYPLRSVSGGVWSTSPRRRVEPAPAKEAGSERGGPVNPTRPVLNWSESPR